MAEKELQNHAQKNSFSLNIEEKKFQTNGQKRGCKNWEQHFLCNKHIVGKVSYLVHAWDPPLNRFRREKLQGSADHPLPSLLELILSITSFVQYNNVL